jgi:hypothetical protein
MAISATKHHMNIVLVQVKKQKNGKGRSQANKSLFKTAFTDQLPSRFRCGVMALAMAVAPVTPIRFSAIWTMPYTNSQSWKSLRPTWHHWVRLETTTDSSVLAVNYSFYFMVVH